MKNTPLFDKNTTPWSLRQVCEYEFHLCGHDSCSCALPFIRLLKSYRPASTPSKTWLETCNANLTMSATLKTVIGHENAHAWMSAFLAIISAIFTKLLQLKWSETDNCIQCWDSDSVSAVANDEEPWCCVP